MQMHLHKQGVHLLMHLLKQGVHLLMHLHNLHRQGVHLMIRVCEEGALPALPDDDSPPFLPRPMDPSLARMYEELTIDSTPYHHLMLDPRNRVLSFNRRP